MASPTSDPRMGAMPGSGMTATGEPSLPAPACQPMGPRWDADSQGHLDTAERHMVLGAGLPLAEGLLYICRQRSPLPEALAHLTLSKPALFLAPDTSETNFILRTQCPSIDLSQWCQVCSQHIRALQGAWGAAGVGC